MMFIIKYWSKVIATLTLCFSCLLLVVTPTLADKPQRSLPNSALNPAEADKYFIYRGLAKEDFSQFPLEDDRTYFSIAYHFLEGIVLGNYDGEIPKCLYDPRIVMFFDIDTHYIGQNYIYAICLKNPRYREHFLDLMRKNYSAHSIGILLYTFPEISMFLPDPETIDDTMASAGIALDDECLREERHKYIRQNPSQAEDLLDYDLSIGYVSTLPLRIYIWETEEDPYLSTAVEYFQTLRKYLDMTDEILFYNYLHGNGNYVNEEYIHEYGTADTCVLSQ